MEYTLIRSKRRTLALQVAKDLSVIVRAPMRLSRKEIEHFVEAHHNWIETHLEKQRRHNEAHPPPSQEEMLELREKAKTVIPQRVQHFSRVMGLEPASVRITQARTRFGSCSGKNNLCFSYLLMRFPIEAVDYVVVHELAHIVHKNHGPDFYALVASILPDYKERKMLLTLR